MQNSPVVVSAHYSSNVEAEAIGSLRVGGQSDLYTDFKISLNYIRNPVSKQTNIKHLIFKKKYDHIRDIFNDLKFQIGTKIIIKTME